MVQVAQEPEAFRNYSPPEGTTAEEFATQKATLTAISKGMRDGSIYIEGTVCLPGGWKITGQSSGAVSVLREDGEEFMMSQRLSPAIAASAWAEYKAAGSPNGMGPGGRATLSRCTDFESLAMPAHTADAFGTVEERVARNANLMGDSKK